MAQFKPLVHPRTPIDQQR